MFKNQISAAQMIKNAVTNVSITLAVTSVLCGNCFFQEFVRRNRKHLLIRQKFVTDKTIDINKLKHEPRYFVVKIGSLHYE